MEKSKFECLICLENPQLPAVTPCGHFFCVQCIEKWMKQAAFKLTCPACKASISRETIIKMNVADLRTDQDNMENQRKDQDIRSDQINRQHQGDALSFVIKALIIMVFAMILYSIGFR